LDRVAKVEDKTKKKKGGGTITGERKDLLESFCKPEKPGRTGRKLGQATIPKNKQQNKSTGRTWFWTRKELVIATGRTSWVSKQRAGAQSRKWLRKPGRKKTNWERKKQGAKAWRNVFGVGKTTKERR